jgi:hypothetical protein
MNVSVLGIDLVESLVESICSIVGLDGSGAVVEADADRSSRKAFSLYRRHGGLRRAAPPRPDICGSRPRGPADVARICAAYGAPRRRVLPVEEDLKSCRLIW